MTGIKSILQAIGCCLSGLLLLLSTASSVTAQVNTTDKDVPVQIRLNLDKKRIMVGEPLFFAFEVTNLSGEKLCLDVGGDYHNRFGRPNSFTVWVKDNNGKTLPQFEVENLGGLVGCDAIQPGATYAVKLFLPHWATIERPGSYQITVARGLKFSSFGPGAKNPKYAMFADVNAELTVVPVDENKMGGVINSLGSIMLDISDPRAVDSATALASIQDKRTISYFAEALRKFGDFQLEASLKGEYTIAARAIAALAKYDDDRAIEALQGVMSSRSEETRLNVAFALADSPHKSALNLLLKMQDDHYHSVRLKVALRLKNVKTPEARAALQKLLQDGVDAVRRAAKNSLK